MPIRCLGETLAGISVSHLYNLRQSKAYQRQRLTFEKTRPKSSTIGERRKPCSNGQPGYIRIDTVHQGDLDKQKGVYHINAVDEVTQFEVVCCVERISDTLPDSCAGTVTGNLSFWGSGLSFR